MFSATNGLVPVNKLLSFSGFPPELRGSNPMTLLPLSIMKFGLHFLDHTEFKS